MFEDYEGRYIQFYLKENAAGVADICGIVERIDVITMPNGTIEIIFILDTQQDITYDVPYRNIAFMVASRVEASGKVGRPSLEGKSLGMVTAPSDYAKKIVGERDSAQDSTLTEMAEGKPEEEDAEKISLGENRQPVSRVTRESMQID